MICKQVCILAHTCSKTFYDDELEVAAVVHLAVSWDVFHSFCVSWYVLMCRPAVAHYTVLRAILLKYEKWRVSALRTTITTETCELIKLNIGTIDYVTDITQCAKFQKRGRIFPDVCEFITSLNRRLRAQRFKGSRLFVYGYNLIVMFLRHTHSQRRALNPHLLYIDRFNSGQGFAFRGFHKHNPWGKLGLNPKMALI